MAEHSLTKSQEPALPHRVVLDERQQIEISGVREILRFDETQVLLRTAKGPLLLGGEGLKLRTLTPEDGRVRIDGAVSALRYGQIQSGGFWKRLFG